MSKPIPKLKYWADHYAKKFFNDTIDHPIYWKKSNSFLGRVRWRLTSSNEIIDVIDIIMNPAVLDNDLWHQDGFHKILIHELCHYFLAKRKINHKEFDEIFLDELRRCGGSMPHKHINTDWFCKNCGKFLFRNKNFSKKKFENAECCSKRDRVTGIKVIEMLQ